MKKYKKGLIAVCMVALLVGSTGCGIGKRTTKGIYQEDGDYLITVAFVGGGQDSQWKEANLESLRSVLIEENGYEFLWEDAKLDQSEQMKAMRKYIEEGVDYLILDPVIETGWEEVFQEAKDAMIPVIVSNHHVDVEDTSLYQCWIGGNFRKEGETAAKWLEDELKEEEKDEEDVEEDDTDLDEEADEAQSADGSAETQKEGEDRKADPQSGSEAPETETGEKEKSIKEPEREGDGVKETEGDEKQTKKEEPEEKEKLHHLAVIQGPIGDAMQMERTEGFGTVAMKHPEWIMAAQQTAEGRKDLAKEVTRMFLEDNPEIDILVAESDEMALGSIEAITEMGKTCGPEGEIKILSYGAGSDILEAMKAGYVNAAFENDPLIGPRIAEIIQRLESGVPIEKQQYMKGSTIDASMDIEEVLRDRAY